MNHVDVDKQETGEARKMMAAMIASGLVAAHGIDAGGIAPAALADKALAFADAICAAVDKPTPEVDEDGDEIPKEE